MFLRNLKVFAPENGDGGAGASAADTSSAEFSFEDVERILSHDPFAQASSQEGDGSGAEVEAVEEDETSTEPEVPAATTSGAPGEMAENQQQASAPASIPGLSEEVLLRGKVAMLEQQLAARSVAQPPAPQQQASSAPVEIPAYNFQFPIELQKMLDSEDAATRMQGMQYALMGMARAVHENLRTEYQQFVKQSQPDVTTTVQGILRQQEQQRAIFDDFYGTYKELNNPALHSVVVAVGQQLFQQNPGIPWGPEVKKELARRTYQILGKPLPGSSAPKKKAPAMLGPGGTGGGGARSKGAIVANSQEDLFSTLFG